MSASTGRWPVLLSGRAVRELRVLSKESTTLDIVQSKFRELSNGIFTEDNCLPIQESKQYIPIYIARVTISNDLRIVYLIDLAVDRDKKFDHQIVKVVSISPRDRIACDFWVKVSKYLARQGSEYRSRCKRREELNTSHGRIIVPCTFHHLDYILTYEPSKTADTGLDTRELHEAVTLERFTPMTKAVYNSILADMEAILPMALNPDERAIVHHHGTSVVIGRSGTGKTTALIYKMRANSQLEVQSRPIRQLFVTRSRVLAQHIASNYRGLEEFTKLTFRSTSELEEMRKANQNRQPRELVEFDNEVDLREDLPPRFSQLTDAHFPLFISFDKLCDLLGADINAKIESSVSAKVAKVRYRTELTFSDFKHRYWPSFDQRLTRHLNPALVYSEILGVIKGYGQPLSREQYLSTRSDRRASLLANYREIVYSIYELYTQKRIRNNAFDAADRAQSILAHYKLEAGPTCSVDYIFVDEVQDHLMLEVQLLQSLCSNIHGGYWCGDTAQTISVGSSFSVRDFKALIHGHMISNTKNSRQRRKTTSPFTTFELTVNFRSHSGIVAFAASLVELIYTVFPHSIDHMQPESAKTPGAPPLLFVYPEDANSEALFASNLLNEISPGKTAPFGAQQTIIVRSESTAKALNHRLQKSCTILTLCDTKGLEFDDLILYNFFTESEASSSTWRAILLGLTIRQDNDRIQYKISKPEHLVEISPTLCSELKQLYVAVTRARHRCWLWDSDKLIDLMQFWENWKLITISESLVTLGQFAEFSRDVRQWARKGQEFFSNGLYALAVSCFERAGLEKDAVIASAYQRMSEARILPEDGDEFKHAMIDAAHKMQACAESSDFVHSSHSAATLWFHAATSFENAEEVTRAIYSYRNGGFYDQAARLCLETQNMDTCFEIWLAHRTRMDMTLAQEVKAATSDYLLRGRKYSNLVKLFDGNIEECIDFAHSKGLSAQAKELRQMNERLDQHTGTE